MINNKNSIISTVLTCIICNLFSVAAFAEEASQNPIINSTLNNNPLTLSMQSSDSAIGTLATITSVTQKNIQENKAMSVIFNASSYQDGKVYNTGDIVNIGGRIYRANWWTQGIDPATTYGIGTPWTLVESRENSGIPDAYSASQVYTKGDIVSLNGVLYVAKWYTSGDNPKDRSGQYDVWQQVQSIRNGVDITVKPDVFDANQAYQVGDIVSYTLNGKTLYYEASGSVKGIEPSATNRGATNPWTLIIPKASPTQASDPIVINVQPELPSLPAAPKNISSAATDSGLILSWLDDSKDSSSNVYDVYQNGQLIANDVKSNSVALKGLSSGAKYDFDIVAENRYGSSAKTSYSFTMPQKAAAESNPLDSTRPDLPSGIQVSNISANQATASWNSIPYADYYEVTLNPFNGQSSTTTTTQNNSIIFTNLNPSSQYQYFIKSVNNYVDAQGVSRKIESAQNQIYFVTPTSSAGQQSNQNQVIQVQQSAPTQTQVTSEVVTSTQLTQANTVASGKDHYIGGDVLISGGAVYKANWWTNTTPSRTDPSWSYVGPADKPGVPLDIQVSKVGTKSVNLNWSSGSGYAEKYEVQVFKDANGSVNSYSNSQTPLKTVVSSNNSAYISGLDADTQYDFRIKAINSAGESGFSTLLNNIQTMQPSTQTSKLDLLFSPYIDTSLNNFSSIIEKTKQNNVIFKDNAKTHNGITLAFLQGNGSGGMGWAGIGDFKTDDNVNYTDSAGKYSSKSLASIVSELQDVQNLDITISVGGLSGTDPAVYAAKSGQSANDLADLFSAVATRYGVNKLDFDVEAGARFNQSADILRGKAINIVEERMGGDDKVEIVFTLPVMQTGLVQDGIDTIKATVAQGVTIDRVNIMAMDYGTGERDMGAAAIAAIQNTEKQLDALGLHHVKIGVIPMIGENDTRNDAAFTLDDARELYDYAISDPRVTEISYWSLGRDVAGNGEVSPVNSGIPQQAYEFASIFQGVNQ